MTFTNIAAKRQRLIRRICKAALIILSIGAAAVNFGCSVRSVATSVPSRIFREVHGLRIRSYQLTPVTDDLRAYRRVEIHPLENLMLDEIPELTVKQLNTEIINRTRSVNRFDRITQVDQASNIAERPADQSAAERPADQSAAEAVSREQDLIVEGSIDDYTPGIPALRYIEQGNNHAVLTVRIRLKDKQTARTLGEMNITVENTRVTSNVERMVEKAAEEVAKFVGRTTRYNTPMEARY
jgi:hypothetical protein